MSTPHAIATAEPDVVAEPVYSKCFECDGFGTIETRGKFTGVGCPCADCCAVENECPECKGTGRVLEE